MSETAEKAIKVLELLSTYDAPVRLVDLSLGLKMNKSTTYRLLEKMRQLGYVRQDEPNGRYMLTVRMWEVGVRAFRRFDMRFWARPYLEKIHQATNETTVLAVLDGGEVVIVDKIDSLQAVQTFSPLGSRSPLHCSSLGKAFLMTNLDRLLLGRTEPLQAFTPNTVTTFAKLRQDIAVALEDGVAVAFDEYREGVSGVSAPVHGVEGVALGAIGITLPTSRAKGAPLAKAKAAVREGAIELSRALGRSEI
ncbi:IclR family transcriptional regulator [Phreatobacter aquaticus]|uniref:IclR family transcriptional regulator n=1 Tax=Phreatobacter aquaticus TaxID=2570229 RepID=UPI00143DFB7F|nr:IclR family transcriptional regulator [Phreatobacter aquaticus]